MSKLLIALVSASLLVLGGCAGGSATKAEAPPPAAKAEAKAEAKPALSEDAKQALAKAEADVKTAKSKKILWTVANVSMEKANEAAKDGDSAGVIKFSKATSDFVKLALEQAQYPETK